MIPIPTLACVLALPVRECLVVVALVDVLDNTFVLLMLLLRFEVDDNELLVDWLLRLAL